MRLVGVVAQLKEENRALRQRQDTLSAERATLMQKNEQVRARVEAMIGRPEGHGERRMSSDPSRISVKILEKEYHVTCPVEERPALIDSANTSTARCGRSATAGKVIGLDRIAVMAALNIVNEAAPVARPRRRGSSTDLATRIKAMRERVESALTRSQLGN